MKRIYSDIALVIRWCVSCVIALVIALPTVTSVAHSV